jgi:CRP-like cAMP-binding protein
VRIESGGVMVGTCAVGDFLGEMTYANGNAATATAIANEQVRVLRFERHALEKAQHDRPVLKLALQASLNRNLIDKLMRANQAPLSRTAS